MYSDTYRCRACTHEFTHDHKGFWIGPLPPRIDGRIDPTTWEKFEAERTRTFTCPACNLELTLPSNLDRAAWLKWRVRDEAWFRRYPFLVGLVARIEESFSHEPWLVDIGRINCPYCTTELVAARFEPVCPQCGSSELEHTDQWHSQTRDPWPPII